MSSAESAAPKPYFCYQCNRTVSITISASSELLCPLCDGGFVEEDENPNPNPSPSPSPFHHFFADPFSPHFGFAGFPLVFSAASGGFDLQPPPSDPSLRSSSAPDPDSFSPLTFIQNHLHNLMAGGASIQFVIENSSDPGGGGGGGGGSFRLPANFGDYFLGPGLEQLIQQLVENDPNRYGTPPAAKSAVESLPSVKVSEELLASEYSAQCAVCMDAFKLGAEGKQMPCKHVFHPDCILPWLDLHNSCPVCRYELPTDDPDYEHRVRGGPPPPPPTSANEAGAANVASGSAGGGTGQGGSAPTTPTTERRFRISLPWPVRVRRTPAEASNSRNNDNRNEGEGDLNSGPQARQEDLD